MSKPTKHQEPNPDDSDSKKELREKVRPQVDAYLKYSGMAIQMGVIILLGTLAGQWIDERYQTERPYFTVLLALLSIFAALYVSLKDLLFQDSGKDKKKKK